MSITYQCERCGRWYTVRESKVGTLARCKDCDHEMVVPSTPDLFDDTVDGPAGGAAIPASRRPSASASATSIRLDQAARPSGRGDEASGKLWGGGLGVAGVVLLVVLRVLAHGGLRGPRPPGQRGNAPPRVAAAPQQRPVGNLDAPVDIPKVFPELGPPQRLEKGVVLREARLRVAEMPAPPGHSGALWLYLPEPEKGPLEPRSLPCVLIAPAGSDCVSGMALSKGDPRNPQASDMPEHLPYVRAGFAVLAFELDGPDPAPAGTMAERRIHVPPGPCMDKFLRARAGLVNGKIAKEFLKLRAPAVDPDRLYVAGHSSAATFALLFAEHDRDIKGCVAYAPIVDLEAWFTGRRGGLIRRVGFGDLITRCSPRADEARLNCPVFLFHSRKDEFVPYMSTEEFAEGLLSAKKPVTLKLVDDNDRDHHYEPMLKQGIPAAIDWLKARDAEVRAGKK
jgi:dienelactone hydrolase/DNA-directed RNA polymerase subunit RPC12/RpoP